MNTIHDHLPRFTWLLDVPTADLSKMAYICGQVDTYTPAGLPAHAAALSSAIQAEQRRRDAVVRQQARVMAAL